MENASKALIIAGAILLSILIIGLGITVYNNASSTSGQADLSGQEITAHNSKFDSYAGKQKGSQVKALVNTIKSNNKEYADRQIKIFYSTTSTTATGYDSYSNTKIDVNSTDDVNESELYTKLNQIKNATTYYINFMTGENGVILACDIHVYSQTD